MNVNNQTNNFMKCVTEFILKLLITLIFVSAYNVQIYFPSFHVISDAGESQTLVYPTSNLLTN